MQTLSIIGCGKVGKTLGYLFKDSKRYVIQDIMCRTLESSIESQQFIGEGRAINDINELRKCDVMCIAVNDDELPSIISVLKALPKIIFHCSGSSSSEVLQPLKENGATVASVHPIKSFSDPDTDINTFTGTYCTLEGDEFATHQLRKDLEAIGAQVVLVSTSQKMLYHIATIFSSNYLVTLIEIALQFFEQAGIPRGTGQLMLRPLVEGVWQKIQSNGTTSALTGPISRGDVELITTHYNYLREKDRDVAIAYKILGKFTIPLADKKGNLSDTLLEELRLLLN